MYHPHIIRALSSEAAYYLPHKTFFLSIIARQKYFNARLKSGLLLWFIHFLFLNGICYALSNILSVVFYLSNQGGITHG